MEPKREQELIVVTDGHVRTLTINRPERSNALSRALMDRMISEVLDASDDPDVWVLVVTGAGERTFCAGADIKDIQTGDAAGNRLRGPMHRPQRSLFEVLWDFEKPTIAAVNGHALGGGLELALSCDLRIVSASARLGMPEAKLGMGANFGTVVLPRLVPPAIAMEWLVTGEPFTPEEALRWGLANRVVPRSDVHGVAANLAAQIAANAPISVRRMKGTIRKGLDLPVHVALRLEIGPSPYSSEDRVEGISARSEKRPPKWRGR